MMEEDKMRQSPSERISWNEFIQRDMKVQVEDTNKMASSIELNDEHRNSYIDSKMSVNNILNETLQETLSFHTWGSFNSNPALLSSTLDNQSTLLDLLSQRPGRIESDKTDSFSPEQSSMSSDIEHNVIYKGAQTDFDDENDNLVRRTEEKMDDKAFDTYCMLRIEKYGKTCPQLKGEFKVVLDEIKIIKETISNMNKQLISFESPLIIAANDQMLNEMHTLFKSIHI